jgi:hypothetical protein
MSGSSSDDNQEIKIKAANEVQVNNDEGFNRLLGLLHTDGWAWVIVVLIIVTLFLQDVAILAFDKSGDVAVTVIYIVIGAIFLGEFLVLCFAQEDYARYDSIFMWADLISLGSMIVDCIPLSVYGSTQGENAANVLDSVINALRILRLFRLWRIFRIFKLIEIYMNKDFKYAAKLSQSLATFLAMKLSLIIILLCSFITILKWDNSYIGEPMSLQILEALTLFSPEFNSSRDLIINRYKVLKIEMFNKTIFENGNLANFRLVEIEDFTTKKSRMIVDVSEALRGSAVVNIILIIILMVFFVLIVFIVRRDVTYKFKKVFSRMINQIENIAENMKLLKSTDEKVKNPRKFYNDLLTRVRDRSSNEKNEPKSKKSSKKSTNPTKTKKTSKKDTKGKGKGKKSAKDSSSQGIIDKGDQSS